jgi:hypothetical protein
MDIQRINYNPTLTSNALGQFSSSTMTMLAYSKLAAVPGRHYASGGLFLILFWKRDVVVVAVAVTVAAAGVVCDIGDHYILRQTCKQRGVVLLLVLRTRDFVQHGNMRQSKPSPSPTFMNLIHSYLRRVAVLISKSFVKRQTSLHSHGYVSLIFSEGRDFFPFLFYFTFISSN